MDPRRRSRGLLATTALLVVGALSACGDDSPGVSDAGGGHASAPPADARAGESRADGAGVANKLEGLGSVLEISLPEAGSYELEGDTLLIRFSSGSKDDVTAHCLIARSAAQGLGLPEDHRLVMGYPDGERECAS
ncbi:hypothetical protein [Nocardioides sp. L-11A]|uniref:hypothetical protein n=1 Tax=Nocardioides sp. L-11A TaxID=3043848 RepID=UPI00249B2881|nr:hypothetical protein QJ852_24725 [Nocardioides sp. L-11A]